jgi:hypothetical protein
MFTSFIYTVYNNMVQNKSDIKIILKKFYLILLKNSYMIILLMFP